MNMCSSHDNDLCRSPSPCSSSCETALEGDQPMEQPAMGESLTLRGVANILAFGVAHLGGRNEMGVVVVSGGRAG